MTISLASRIELVKLIFAEYVSSILPLDAKIIVIKLRPYSMLNYTLPQIQQCLKNFAAPSRSGDISLQSQKTCFTGAVNLVILMRTLSIRVRNLCIC